MYVCSQKLVYNCHVIVCATETPSKRNRTQSHHPSVLCGRSNSAPMRSSPSRPRQYYDRPSSFYYDSYSNYCATSVVLRVGSYDGVVIVPRSPFRDHRAYRGEDYGTVTPSTMTGKTRITIRLSTVAVVMLARTKRPI